MSVIIYLLPAALIFVGIYLIICVVKRNKKGIIKTSAVILAALIAMALYYYPQTNILKAYDFDYISIDGESFGYGNVKITDREDVDKVLNVINRHTFIRSAVKTTESQLFPGDDLVTLSMWDYKKSAIFHLYILDENSDKDLLQKDNVMYNVKDKEGISKDIFNVLKQINVMQ